MKRTRPEQEDADTRPTVLVSSRLKDTNDTKNLGVYFKLRISRELKADYIFSGVHRISMLAVITIDLRPWDRGIEILDMIEQLQNEEEEFLKRLLETHARFRMVLGVSMTDQEASRRRFMKLQESILGEPRIKESNPSKLMMIPVDNKHGIAEELAEIR